MPPPLSPATIEAVEADIRAGYPRNEVARRNHVALASVSKIAAKAGLSFDRSKTENATRARQADNKSRRAALAEKFLRRADELLDAMDQPHIAFSFGGRDNVYTEKRLDKPPVSDIRNLMTAAAVAVDKSIAIDRHDNTGGDHADVDAWLEHMTGGGP